MTRLRIGLLAASIAFFPIMTFAQESQRGPETQKQSPGQNSPDINPSGPPTKQEPSGGSGSSKDEGTATHTNRKTKQKLHKSHPDQKQNLREHGGSHDQGTPDQTNPQS